MSKFEALEFLEQMDHPEQIKQHLTDFWEGWLTNPDNESCDVKERSNKLCFYKNLMALIDTLS